MLHGVLIKSDVPFVRIWPAERPLTVSSPFTGYIIIILLAYSRPTAGILLASVDKAMRFGQAARPEVDEWTHGQTGS